MKTTIEVTGAQIFRLREFETNRPYDKDCKLAGQTYSRVSYNGSVFVINSKDPFLADLKAGRVHTAFLIESQEESKNAEGEIVKTTKLAFDGYANNNQVIGMTKTESVLKAILSGNFKADAELTDADMEVFQEAAS